MGNFAVGHRQQSRTTDEESGGDFHSGIQTIIPQHWRTVGGEGYFRSGTETTISHRWQELGKTFAVGRTDGGETKTAEIQRVKRKKEKGNKKNRDLKREKDLQKAAAAVTKVQGFLFCFFCDIFEIQTWNFLSSIPLELGNGFHIRIDSNFPVIFAILKQFYIDLVPRFFLKLVGDKDCISTVVEHSFKMCWREYLYWKNISYQE